VRATRRWWCRGRSSTGPGSATAFADRLAEAPIGRIFQTSISGAIDFQRKLLDETGAEPLRKVIDVSGDGPNSSGRSPALARDEAVAKGITINGLPIMLKRPTGFGDMENLDHYYRDCVIGGAGAFLVPGARAPAFRRRDQDQDPARDRRPAPQPREPSRVPERGARSQAQTAGPGSAR
jgi:hypothetical protein